MPVYLQGFNGSYTNAFEPPDTLNHITQFLGRVHEDDWEQVRGHIKTLSESPSGSKIKPSSYRKILAVKKPHHLIPHIIKEHQDHANHHKEAHLGGGIHEGISNALTTISQTVGGEKASSWVGPVFQQRVLDDKEKDMAELLSLTYQDTRAEHHENFMRLPEYDTRYGSLFVDTHGEYTFAVRGTKGNMRDIWKDIKIAAGSVSSRDRELVDSFQKFKTKYPTARVNIAGHSLGTELMFSAADEVGLHVREFYAFNPASSPSQPKEHIRKNLERKNAEFYLNSNDIVSKTYLQLAKETESDRIAIGKFLRNPISAHKLGQWIS